MERHRDSRDVRQVLAVSLAIVASSVVLLVPTYSQAKVTAGGLEQVKHLTLLELIGPSILVPLLIPVVLTALPLLIRGRARASVSVVTTAALASFVLIGSASIGWFYAPALAAAVAAVIVSIGSRPRLPIRSK
jgi:hypothetical protein